MRYILDCDPGHDDMLAILLAAQHLDVVGVTTVSGNQSLDKVTHNARVVAELARLDAVPVAAGMARPLVNAPVHAPEIHGRSGLDGAELPEPSIPLSASSAVELIVDRSRRHDNLWIVATGPLTNLAVALIQEPDLARRVQGINLMGGSLTHGNSTAVAEFNIWADPEAADVVFRSGIPIRMYGLNVTRRVGAGRAEIDRIRDIGTSMARIVADLLGFYRQSLERALGVTTASLHDPLAVAGLIDPGLCELRPMHVAIELHGRHTCGMTVCDYRDVGEPGTETFGGIRGREEPNAEVAVDVDPAGFFDLLTDALARY